MKDLSEVNIERSFSLSLRGIHLVLLNRLNAKKNDGGNNGFTSVENCVDRESF